MNTRIDSQNTHQPKQTNQTQLFTDINTQQASTVCGGLSKRQQQAYARSQGFADVFDAKKSVGIDYGASGGGDSGGSGSDGLLEVVLKVPEGIILLF